MSSSVSSATKVFENDSESKVRHRSHTIAESGEKKTSLRKRTSISVAGRHDKSNPGVEGRTARTADVLRRQTDNVDDDDGENTGSASSTSTKVKRRGRRSGARDRRFISLDPKNIPDITAALAEMKKEADTAELKRIQTPATSSSAMSSTSSQTFMGANENGGRSATTTPAEVNIVEDMPSLELSRLAPGGMSATSIQAMLKAQNVSTGSPTKGNSPRLLARFGLKFSGERVFSSDPSLPTTPRMSAVEKKTSIRSVSQPVSYALLHEQSYTPDAISGRIQSLGKVADALLDNNKSLTIVTIESQGSQLATIARSNKEVLNADTAKEVASFLNDLLAKVLAVKNFVLLVQFGIEIDKLTQSRWYTEGLQSLSAKTKFSLMHKSVKNEVENSLPKDLKKALQNASVLLGTETAPAIEVLAHYYKLFGSGSCKLFEETVQTIAAAKKTVEYRRMLIDDQVLVNFLLGKVADENVVNAISANIGWTLRADVWQVALNRALDMTLSHSEIETLLKRVGLVIANCRIVSENDLALDIQLRNPLLTLHVFLRSKLPAADCKAFWSSLSPVPLPAANVQTTFVASAQMVTMDEQFQKIQTLKSGKEERRLLVQTLTRDLRVHYSRLFNAIHLQEFHRCAWTRDDSELRAPNIHGLIHFSNALKAYVSASVLEVEYVRGSGDVKLNGMAVKAMIKFFIDLLDACVIDCNYEAAFNLFMGLNDTAITRLLGSKEFISKKRMASWKEKVELFQPANNFKNLRSAIAKNMQENIGHGPVMVFGMFLKDLFAIDENNQTFVAAGNAASSQSASTSDSSPLINLSKLVAIRDQMDYFHSSQDRMQMPKLICLETNFVISLSLKEQVSSRQLDSYSQGFLPKEGSV